MKHYCECGELSDYPTCDACVSDWAAGGGILARRREEREQVRRAEDAAARRCRDTPSGRSPSAGISSRTDQPAGAQRLAPAPRR
jgi:hypothetical protein